jgi:hypothetical protein
VLVRIYACACMLVRVCLFVRVSVNARSMAFLPFFLLHNKVRYEGGLQRDKEEERRDKATK